MRMTTTLLIGLLFLINVSCKGTEEVTRQEHSAPIVATFADEEITFDELKKNISRNRNAGQAEIDSLELREFLPSYVEYRIKLYEGYRQGLDKDPEILSEYNSYASEAATRFWIENEIKEKRIETFKERFEHELKAFHILKELPQDAPPQDTLEVYRELMAVRDSLLNGADPEEMNQKHSSKREGNPVGGRVQWITAGNTIQPFEDALYQLHVGEVSLPVRTQFGYHLIILEDKRPRSPHRLVKHIYFRKQEDGAGLEKAAQAYEALQSDTTWSDAVQAYTEDPSTKNRDGQVGWVGYGTRYPFEFIEAVMEASPESSFSRPVETSYGAHIIKIDSVRTFLTEEEKEEFILNRLRSLDRLDPDKDDVYERIAAETGLRVDHQTFSSLNDMLSMVPHQPELVTLADSELRTQPLFTAFDSTYSVNHFLEWVDRTTDSPEEAQETSEYLENYKKSVIDEHIVDYTIEKFPEFADEARHFLNGLIVFRINEENIWSPETVNRDEMREYYNSNRENYKRGKTFVYTVISDTSESVMKEVHSLLADGTETSELSAQFKTLEIKADSTFRKQSAEYSILEELQPGKFSEPLTVDGKVSVYILDEVLEPRILTFGEAFDRVFSDYQPIREENYINRLKERYSVKLYPENVH